MTESLRILAQQPAPAGGGPFPSLDTIFWASVLVIFFVTIFTALLRRLSKDKALKLFNDYHVAFFSERRPALWGDLVVFSQGVEMVFDQPYLTYRQLTKSSALLYDDEFTPMIAFTRSVHGLTAREKKLRAHQIRRTFKPNLLRRSRRWSSNLLNTLRDAISKTMSLVIGRMTAAGAAGAALSTQAGDINSLTGAVVGFAANAYEPLLERYIGRPVVVEINLPVLPGAPAPPNGIPETAEFPGYLVDYTQRFLAVFNVEQTPVETIDIHLEPGKPADPDLADLKFTFSTNRTTIYCAGKDAFVLRHIRASGETSDLGIAMIPGTTIILAPIDKTSILTVERTRHIDLVVPRNRARIRFGAMAHPPSHRGRHNWLGVSPLLEPREFLQTLRENIHLPGNASRRHLVEQVDENPPDSSLTKD